jgi:hypothetical protein
MEGNWTTDWGIRRILRFYKRGDLRPNDAVRTDMLLVHFQKSTALTEDEFESALAIGVERGWLSKRTRSYALTEAGFAECARMTD